MVKYITFILMLLFFFISKPSFALGKLGHQIVCQLAYENLSETNQNKITVLINAIPKEHQRLINHYNYKNSNEKISFANACTWADAIKRLENFKSYNAWHYMNVPRSQKKVKEDDCQSRCITQAILEHQKALSYAEHTNIWQQTKALLFLGHWLGDIHQPLHVSFQDDLGGNRIKFSHLDTKCKNLHQYWDVCILYKGKQSKQKWLTLLRDNWLQGKQPNWHKEQVWQWADESFQIVRESEFQYCIINNQGRCQKPQQKIKLPKGYLLHYQKVMKNRLLLASHRLANILEASL